MENSDNLYKYLILFLVLVFIHKSITLTILFNTDPNYVRRFFNILEPILLLFLLFYYDLNTYLRLILVFLFISPLRYWLIEKRYIYNFINKNPRNERILDAIDNYSYLIIGTVWLFLFCSLVYFLN